MVRARGRGARVSLRGDAKGVELVERTFFDLMFAVKKPFRARASRATSGGTIVAIGRTASGDDSIASASFASANRAEPSLRRGVAVFDIASATFRLVGRGR